MIHGIVDKSIQHEACINLFQRLDEARRSLSYLWNKSVEDLSHSPSDRATRGSCHPLLLVELMARSSSSSKYIELHKHERISFLCSLFNGIRD